MSETDQTALVQKLFVQHIPAIKFFALSLLPNANEAEDVVQEVFLTVTAKANDFEKGTNFKAWALAITRFKVLEIFRRQKRERERLSDEVIEALVAEAEEPDPAKEAVRMKALARCIEKLAPKPKLMIELLYKEGLKPASIADKIGWEANAVYVTLSRARSSLRTCIERQLRGAP